MPNLSFKIASTYCRLGSQFWEKYVFPKKYKNDKIVICGHTSRKDGNIANFGHTICIDTYAYGGKWLSCLNVENNNFIKSNNAGKLLFGTL